MLSASLRDKEKKGGGDCIFVRTCRGRGGGLGTFTFGRATKKRELDQRKRGRDRIHDEVAQRKESSHILLSFNRKKTTSLKQMNQRLVRKKT